MSTLRALVASSRPLSWVNTAYPFAAAYFLLARVIDAPLVVGALFFLVPYNYLMYGINDVFDYESDVRNPRKGGVEGAVLDRRMHRLILWSAPLFCLPLVIYLCAVGGPFSCFTLAVAIFAVVAYSAKGLRFKEIPVLDSVTSALHFVLPMVFGVALAIDRGALIPARTASALVVVTVAFFLWSAASHAFGAVQDVTSDREGGIRSIATQFGARATVRLAMLAYLLSAVSLWFLPLPWGVVSVIPLAYLANIAPYSGVTDAECGRANVAWRRFLGLNYASGFLVTLALIAVVIKAL